MGADGGILNRFGDNLFNWNSIEQVKIEDGVAYLFFKSGRSEIIEGADRVEKLRDFIQIFPDISNDIIRNKMKQEIQGLKTDINENTYQSMRGKVKVDMQKPPAPPAPPKREKGIIR